MTIEEVTKSRDQAYHERNLFVKYLSHIYPSHLAKHDEKDTTWEKEWFNIVCVHGFTGQMSWHIHDSELTEFPHLQLQNNDWDGHSTEEKYRRLERLAQS